MECALGDWIGTAANVIGALGSAGAVIAAVALWRADKRHAKEAGAAERAESLRRLVSALRTEIQKAIDSANARQQAVNSALQAVAIAKQRGLPVNDAKPQPGSFVITEGIIYRSVAAELGRLPSSVIHELVAFYLFTFEVTRMAELSMSGILAYETMKDMLPRVRMSAVMVIAILDKFEQGGFSSETDIMPTPDEVRAMAQATGYPLDELLTERGLA